MHKSMGGRKALQSQSRGRSNIIFQNARKPYEREEREKKAYNFKESKEAKKSHTSTMVLLEKDAMQLREKK